MSKKNPVINLFDLKNIECKFLSSEIIVNDTLYKRIDARQGRYYTLDNPDMPMFFGGVTTVIDNCIKLGRDNNQGLLTWYSNLGKHDATRIFRDSAAFGRMAHASIGELFIGNQINLDHESLIKRFENYCQEENYYLGMADIKEWKKRFQKAMIGIVQWSQDFKVRPLAINLPLACGHIVGWLDMVAEITYKEKNGKEIKENCIIDFKFPLSDRPPRPEEIMQLKGYDYLWAMNIKDIKIDSLYIWQMKDFNKRSRTKYKFTNITETANSDWYKWKWDRAVEEWEAFEDLRIPDVPPKLKSDPLTLESDVNNAYQEIIPEEIK